MAIAKGNKTISVDKIDEFYLANRFLNVNKIPCLIRSPLRNDKHPSFSLYSKDGIHIRYKDYATGEAGGIYDLLQQLWNLDFKKVLENICKDGCLSRAVSNDPILKEIKKSTNIPKAKIECRTRSWTQEDLNYWEQFGITKKWLKYAEIYPISHYFVTKGNDTYRFVADKLAFAYVEHKENNTSVKIYQPYNTNGRKWTSGFDGSVISLWTKVPQTGEKIVICSSVKDALCLWANTKVPAIAVQGEGYAISETAKKELLKRYNNVYILFDNDEAGLKDGASLASRTGFKNLILPKINDAKDIAELYQKTDREIFNNIILKLFEQ